MAQPKSEHGHKVPVHEAVRKFTIEVIGSAAFGLDIKVFDNEDQTFYKMSENIFGANDLPTKIKFAIVSNFPKLSTIFKITVIDKKVSGYFKNMLTASLRVREENYKSGGKANDDFMQLLVEARNGNLAPEKNQKMSKEEQEAEMKSGNKNDIEWNDMLTVAQAFVFLAAG